MWQEIFRNIMKTSRFFRAVFLLICIGLGFYIGNRMDEGEDFVDLLDNLLPPYRR